MKSDALPYYLYQIDSSDEQEDWHNYLTKNVNLIVLKIGSTSYAMVGQQLKNDETASACIVEKKRILSIKKGENGMMKTEKFDLLENTLIAQLIIELRRELCYPTSNEDYLSSLLGALLRQIQRFEEDLTQKSNDNYSMTPFQIKKLKDYASNNLNDPLSLENIASHLGYSVFHFCRVFKKATDQSPIQWLKDLRMKEALRLLYYGDTSVAIVSNQIGYKNLSHFSKVFKNKYGYNPSQVLLD